MALSVLSPELVLVDPNLLREMRGRASGPAAEPIPEEQMNGEAMHVNGSNGTAAAQTPAEETPTQASVETILFKAGLITADQLGEVVLERVQSGRSAGEIVVERGLVSPEALAGALAGSAAPAGEPGVPAAAPVQVVEAQVVEAPVVERLVVAAPVVEAPAPVATVAVSEPVAPEAPPVPEPVAATVIEPAPVEPTPVEPAQAEPAPVEAAIEIRSQPEPAPEPVPAPAVAPAPARAAPADDRGFSMGEVQYGIRIRLAEGVTLDAGSHPSRERAIEVARGIAGQLAAEGGEWPLVGDTLVRPDAVLAIEIDSSVSWFSSQA